MIKSAGSIVSFDVVLDHILVSADSQKLTAEVLWGAEGARIGGSRPKSTDVWHLSDIGCVCIPQLAIESHQDISQN